MSDITSDKDTKLKCQHGEWRIFYCLANILLKSNCSFAYGKSFLKDNFTRFPTHVINKNRLQNECSFDLGKRT